MDYLRDGEIVLTNLAETVDAMSAAPSPHAGAVAASETADKTKNGQFFTMVSPFNNDPFKNWVESIPDTTIFVEPFAGANNLVRMFTAEFGPRTWECYDIEPQDPAVIQRDTLTNFPRYAQTVAVVTNPPYLAKNIARRSGHDDVAALCGTYDNLYKMCLDRCLAHADWVAAIIPESFITSKEFRDRLETVISLDRPMFVDTEVPVCLALWTPTSSTSFDVWKGDTRLGSFDDLLAAYPTATYPGITFNDPTGSIALLAVDSPSGATIRFAAGNVVDPTEIKHSSRHRTRISIDGLPARKVNDVIAAANESLRVLRETSHDVSMTAFMGMRADGCYRRRLDFATARALLASACISVLGPPAA